MLNCASPKKSRRLCPTILLVISIGTTSTVALAQIYIPTDPDLQNRIPAPLPQPPHPPTIAGPDHPYEPKPYTPPDPTPSTEGSASCEAFPVYCH
jgi:hypothetical protein